MSDDEVQVVKIKLPKYYRACFVPLCGKNSKNSPSKVFIHFPNDPQKKKLWFKLARRSDNLTNSHFYCCEDHFNVSIRIYN